MPFAPEKGKKGNNVLGETNSGSVGIFTHTPTIHTTQAKIRDYVEGGLPLFRLLEDKKIRRLEIDKYKCVYTLTSLHHFYLLQEELTK